MSPIEIVNDLRRLSMNELNENLTYYSKRKPEEYKTLEKFFKRAFDRHSRRERKIGQVENKLRQGFKKPVL